MKGLLADLRHALRLYGRTPVGSSVMVVILAVAMAFVAALLSLYVDLILRPHPGFERGGGVVTFGWNDGTNAGGLPWELIDRLAEESGTLAAAAGTGPQQFQVGTERELLIAELVTQEFFPGVMPRVVLGRGFEPSEHEGGGDAVAVISHRLWTEQFQARPDVIGDTISVGSPSFSAPDDSGGSEDAGYTEEFRIVGVMTENFTGTLPPQVELQTDVWLPIERGVSILMAGLSDDMTLAEVRSQFVLRGIGRRVSGASWQAILEELNDRFLDELPNFTGRTGTRYDVLDGLVFNANVQRNTQRQLELMLIGSVLLALVAAANVSLFLLARAPGRRRELGIRMSVGAPLRRLARQLATEAGLLVLVGAVLGLALSVWLAEYLRGLNFLQAAQWSNVTLLDWRVLLLVGTFLAVLALLVSLAPVLGLKRLGIAASSRQVSARATMSQHVAGTAQIAIAGALGGAAIAFAWYLGALIYSDPGYETRDIHLVQLQIPITGDSQAFVDAQVENAMVNTIRRRETILGLPGVVDVSMAGMAPGMQANTSRQVVPLPDRPDDQIGVVTTTIDSRYIDLLGLDLLHGRAPTDSDIDVAVVNRTLARQIWGRDDVIGESLPFAVPGGQRTEVIGVIDDVSFQHPEADIEPTVFMTAGFFSNFSLALVESAASSGELQTQLQGLVDAGELELQVQGAFSLAQIRTDLIAPDRARSFLTIGTAALVVLLAAFGFYGTQRYLVTAGRREYAVRASLGAGPRSLGRLVIRRGLWLGLPGLALSLPLAFVVVALLRDDYVSRDISPLGVTLAVLVALIVLLSVASFGPARQARATQPAPLLRED